MSWIGWLLSLLAGALCAVAGWWLWHARTPRRLRYVQAYRPDRHSRGQEP